MIKCKYCFSKDLITYSLGNKNIKKIYHCKWKENNYKNATLVRQAFDCKYRSKGKISVSSSGCDWKIHNDEESCPAFESVN